MPGTSEIEKSRNQESEARIEAWESIVAASAILSEQIEESLSSEGLPSLSWLDVLGALSESEDVRLRPRELVLAVSVTKSGLTRLIDRIAAAGLIERLNCPTDRRGHLVALTDAGAEMVERMRPIRDQVVADHFSSQVSEREARMISEALHRVRDSAAGPPCTDAEEAAVCDEAMNQS